MQGDIKLEEATTEKTELVVENEGTLSIHQLMI